MYRDQNGDQGWRENQWAGRQERCLRRGWHGCHYRREDLLALRQNGIAYCLAGVFGIGVDDEEDQLRVQKPRISTPRIQECSSGGILCLYWQDGRSCLATGARCIGSRGRVLLLQSLAYPSAWSARGLRVGPRRWARFCVVGLSFARERGSPVWIISYDMYDSSFQSQIELRCDFLAAVRHGQLLSHSHLQGTATARLRTVRIRSMSAPPRRDADASSKGARSDGTILDLTGVGTQRVQIERDSSISALEKGQDTGLSGLRCIKTWTRKVWHRLA